MNVPPKITQERANICGRAPEIAPAEQSPKFFVPVDKHADLRCPVCKDGEPVAGLGHDSITTFGQMTYGFIDRRDRAIPDSWIPLYAKPAPFTPITKADITDEMTKAMQTALFADGIDDRDIMVFAVNAYMELKLRSYSSGQNYLAAGGTPPG